MRICVCIYASFVRALVGRWALGSGAHEWYRLVWATGKNGFFRRYNCYN
jgi:hypothetical protein